jgi:ATP-binding cassette, subfamily B, bacterial CvaB/MchF/RaxB
MSVLQTIQELASGPKVPVYHQSEIAECGLACMAMVSTYYGHALTVPEVRARFTPSSKGVSLTELLSIARTLNLSAKAVKLDIPALAQLPLPAIVHWNFNHFVVLTEVTEKGVRINDPAMGARSLTMEEFSKHFTGVALQLSPGDDFTPRAKQPGLRVRDLLGRVRAFKPAMLQVLLFALLLELTGLALPLLNQVVADEVLPNTDASLLTVLAIGFLMLVVVRAGVSFLRDWALALVSLGLKAQVAERVFRHALRLPPQYFERRRSTDIASRFESLAAIERTLATGVLEAVLDGIFSVVIVGVLFTYNGWLGTLVLAGTAAYVIVRALMYPTMRELENRTVESRAQQTGSMLETLRAVIPIQLAGKTPWRLAQWGTHLSTGTNAELSMAKAGARLMGAGTLISGVVTVLFTWVATDAVLNEKMTMGALFAVLAYQQTVSGRLATLVERLMSIRMLSVHLERLADIVYAEPQDIPVSTVQLADDEPITITLEDVKFRFSPSEPEILKGVSLTIRAGEHVALTGASGCGKTTLMKLMLGILEPTGGQILYNGRPLKEFGIEQQRAITAAVLQDDALFYGTVRDNISYFDPDATDEDVMRAASLASIHQEIASMPQNYLGLVGEGSGALSGGQRQRLLLARAMYRKPRVLMLDEATSHLDGQNEAQVNAGINSLNVTRVSIAHRPESLLAAERIVVLHAGKVVQEFTQAQFLQVLQGGAPPA